VLDDRTRDLQQGVPPLLDRLDQPAGRLDPLLDELARCGVSLLVLELFLVITRDRELRCMLVNEPDLILAVLVGLDDQVGDDILRALGEVL